jgi:hypothetical protein
MPVSKLKKQIEAYKEQFQAPLSEGSCRSIVPFSIINGDGRSELLKLIEAHLNESHPRKKEAV